MYPVNFTRLGVVLLDHLTHFRLENQDFRKKHVLGLSRGTVNSATSLPLPIYFRDRAWLGRTRSQASLIGPGTEKAARSGDRGPKGGLAIEGNGASGRMPLLAGGSTTPSRVMSPGSSGSTSSGRPPMNMPLKATISLSAPRPSEKQYDFLAQYMYNDVCLVGIGLLLLVVLLWALPSFLTQVCPALFHIVYPAPPLGGTFFSYAALDETEEFHLVSFGFSQQVYQSERASEETCTADDDFQKPGQQMFPLHQLSLVFL